MENIENEIAQMYSKGILEYLDGYVWYKAIAVWNMSNNDGIFTIYNDENKEIRPQYYRDKNNLEQPNKATAPEEMRTADKKLKEYYNHCKQSKETNWNVGKITIYPSGEYLSEFIWDNEAHLDYLYDKVYNSLCFLAEELSNKITYTLCPETVILWEQTTITLPFVKGKIQPLQIKVKAEEEIIEHFLLIKDITYEESPWLVEQFEEMYQLTNEGELKGKLSERWNTLVICWNLMERFDLEKHIKFEWLPENEA